MKQTDINRYAGEPNPGRRNDKASAGAVTLSVTGKVLKVILKALLTVLSVCIVTGCIVGVSVLIYIGSLSGEKVDYNLRDIKLKLTSFVYVEEGEGNWVEYERLHSSENRVLVEYDQIPKYMKDAMIAIEDKRFLEHNGVDWRRTMGAVLNLFSGEDNYGGSTITQQLIKNLTNEKEVSLTRKIKEIFRAINFEKEYSKDEILEAYLNVVNFGSGCNGVQAAANLYFGKDISECSLAECASIAGITQNPAAYTPLIYPEKNKKRQQTVLGAMFEQEKISQREYDRAMEESEHMVFVGYTGDNQIKDNIPIHDWYTDDVLNEVLDDLMEVNNLGEDAARSMLYSGGFKIYSAVDRNAQRIAEQAVAEMMPVNDPALDVGYIMMDYNGRVLASMGGRQERTGNWLFSNSTMAKRQPGSTFKPIAVYAPAIEYGLINYSSSVEDQPIKIDINADNVPDEWPVNYTGVYQKHPVTVQWALMVSANAPAARIGYYMVGVQNSFDFLTQKLGFTSLSEKNDVTPSAMILGGMSRGVTVREMAASYQMFGNGGKYYEPYSYYYVLDYNDNLIFDNRDKAPVQAISSKTATIMNRLLKQVASNPEGTGYYVNIYGWDMIAKTGTTSDYNDAYFIGATPYAIGACWVGYANPRRVTQTGACGRVWRKAMVDYLADKSPLAFELDSSIVTREYCKQSGLLFDPEHCTQKAIGYYDPNHLPATCDGTHPGYEKKEESSSASSSSRTSSRTSSGRNSSTGRADKPESNSRTAPESNED